MDAKLLDMHSDASWGEDYVWKVRLDSCGDQRPGVAIQCTACTAPAVHVVLRLHSSPSCAKARRAQGTCLLACRMPSSLLCT